MTDITQQKQAAGIYAANLVEDNTIVGLGTGSTVKFFVEALAQRIKDENLNIVGVTTSNRTTELATKLGIQIKKVDEVEYIDLTIDGADEVDPDLNGIKGGGAALLFEKIVATNSKQNYWIVDESKLSEKLGINFKLPVEVVKYGAQLVFNKLEKDGYKPVWRMTNSQKLETDSNNYIIDIDVSQIQDFAKLANDLKMMTGVVEHGLFLNIAQMIIVGGQEIRTINK